MPVRCFACPSSLQHFPLISSPTEPGCIPVSVGAPRRAVVGVHVVVAAAAPVVAARVRGGGGGRGRRVGALAGAGVVVAALAI